MPREPSAPHPDPWRLQLQTFVDRGLRESPADLRALGAEVLAADDWSKLPLETQAVALVLAKPEETEPWLLALASHEPLRALQLALHGARLTLRFALLDGKLSRVLDRPVRKPAAHLPPPLFWLALRRAFDASPLLRGEVQLPTVEDLRLRAALSFLFPDDAGLWTEAEHAQGLAMEDPLDASFVLFAVLRSVPSVASSTVWPPPAKSLKGLTDAQLEEVSSLVRDEKLLVQKRRRAEAKRASVDVRPLLEAVTEPDALQTLALVTPSAALLEQVLGLPTPADRAESVLRDSFLQGWARELQPSGPPRDAPWRSPWSTRNTKREVLEPPAGPRAPAGEWERTWLAPKRVPAEARIAWQALQSSDDVDPWDVSQVLPLGPVVLPKLRAWARREPALLVATTEIDDGGLDEALLLAWTSRRRQLALAVREFARRHPERAHAAAIRLCFSESPKERTVGATALRALERGATRELAALSVEQRAWLHQLLEARPELPARKPSLPEFIRFAALPPVVTRDGTQALGEVAVGELLAVMKATPLEDGAPLLSCVGPYSQDSLAEFAGCVFRQWLAAGAPPKEKWALTSLAHFPSEAWAAVVGSLCQQWAQGGFAARAADAVAVLGRMGHRVALTEVHRLATRIRTVGLKARARLAFDEAAARLGLTPPELEDRLFPEVSLPTGASLRLDDALKPVLERLGEKLPLSDDLRLAVKALKPTVARLERLMTEGPPLGALHFTETWGMHPVLQLVAQRVVWGVFRGAARVGLFVPGPTFHGDALPLDDGLGVRPVHRIELTNEELALATGWLPVKPAFEQLTRECFAASELKGRLQALIDREVPVVGVLALERLGWERGPAVEGGLSVDITRRGEAWSVTLQLEPGLYAGDPTALDVQLITGVELESARPLDARVASELQRDLVKCFPGR